MQYSDVREKIGQLVEAFPDEMANAQEYDQLYHGDKGVRLRVTQLSSAVIQALHYIVEWHAEKSSRALSVLTLTLFSSCETCGSLASSMAMFCEVHGDVRITSNSVAPATHGSSEDKVLAFASYPE